MRPSRLTLLMAFALNAGAVAYQWPTAPSVVADHFNGSGNPDGSSTRVMFFALWMGLAALFAGLAVGMGAILPKLSLTSINMPNKELWLAPPHRDATLRQFSDMMAWMMTVASLFVLALFSVTLAANRRQPVHLGPEVFYLAMALEVSILAIVIVYFVRWNTPPTS